MSSREGSRIVPVFFIHTVANIEVDWFSKDRPRCPSRRGENRLLQRQNNSKRQLQNKIHSNSLWISGVVKLLVDRANSTRIFRSLQHLTFCAPPPKCCSGVSPTATQRCINDRTIKRSNDRSFSRLTRLKKAEICSGNNRIR